MLEANCIPKTTPLTDRFGVEVHDFDLTQVRTEDDFRAVRGLFDEHSAMLFRNQDLTDEDHIRLSKFFGSIEDRLADERKPGESYKVPEVSNIREDGTVAEEMAGSALEISLDQSGQRPRSALSCQSRLQSGRLFRSRKRGASRRADRILHPAPLCLFTRMDCRRRADVGPARGYAPRHALAFRGAAQAFEHLQQRARQRWPVLHQDVTGLGPRRCFRAFRISKVPR